jgi:lipopolysaccharide export system protein LptA
MRRSPGSASVSIALCLAALCAGWTPVTTLAEVADRDQPVNIESDSMTADEAKKIATFSGKVVLTQGTMVIRADRIVVQQDDSGFQEGVATGSPATFRRKQEGHGDYIEGEAQRIQYDGRIERVELFDNARLRRDSGDDIRGDYISYDARTERFTVKASDSKDKTEGRVRATIMPKKAAAEGQSPSAPVGKE